MIVRMGEPVSTGFYFERDARMDGIGYSEEIRMQPISTGFLRGFGNGTRI